MSEGEVVGEVAFGNTRQNKQSSREGGEVVVGGTARSGCCSMGWRDYNDGSVSEVFVGSSVGTKNAPAAETSLAAPTPATAQACGGSFGGEAQAPVMRRVCWSRQLRVEGRAITRQVRRIAGIQRGARARDVGGEVGLAIVTS